MELAQGVGLIAFFVVVLMVVTVIVRRIVLVRSGGFDLSWRIRPAADDRGWIPGRARFHGGRLAAYRSFSVWPTPTFTMDRATLSLDAIRAPIRAEPDLLPSGVVIVTGRTSGARLELAVTEDALTALRSWIESRPPGSRAPDYEHLGGNGDGSL